MKALADGFDKVGADARGIRHACYKAYDGLEAWCSLVMCKPVAPNMQVDCVFCLTSTTLHDEEYP